jgi:hypothetical protein
MQLNFHRGYQSKNASIQKSMGLNKNIVVIVCLGLINFVLAKVCFNPLLMVRNLRIAVFIPTIKKINLVFTIKFLDFQK